MKRNVFINLFTIAFIFLFIQGCATFMVSQNKIYEAIWADLNRPVKDLTLDPFLKKLDDYYYGKKGNSLYQRGISGYQNSIYNPVGGDGISLPEKKYIYYIKIPKYNGSLGEFSAREFWNFLFMKLEQQGIEPIWADEITIVNDHNKSSIYSSGTLFVMFLDYYGSHLKMFRHASRKSAHVECSLVIQNENMSIIDHLAALNNLSDFLKINEEFELSFVEPLLEQNKEKYNRYIKSLKSQQTTRQKQTKQFNWVEVLSDSMNSINNYNNSLSTKSKKSSANLSGSNKTTIDSNSSNFEGPFTINYVGNLGYGFKMDVQYYTGDKVRIAGAKSEEMAWIEIKNAYYFYMRKNYGINIEIDSNHKAYIPSKNNTNNGNVKSN